MEDLTTEGEEFIKIVCNYLSTALEEALEEIDEKESLGLDNDYMETAKKHIAKKLGYLQIEGWISDYEDVSIENL